jgi:hypothetical protein
MTTIYILNRGDFIDHRIVALYSTKELAEEAQKLCPDSYIDDYKLDSKEIPEHPPGHTAWCVNIDPENTMIRGSYEENVLEWGFNPGVAYVTPTSWGRRSALVVRCWARDREHAQKIALDKFYQWKYENLPN